MSGKSPDLNLPTSLPELPFIAPMVVDTTYRLAITVAALQEANRSSEGGQGPVNDSPGFLALFSPLLNVKHIDVRKLRATEVSLGVLLRSVFRPPAAEEPQPPITLAVRQAFADKAKLHLLRNQAGFEGLRLQDGENLDRYLVTGVPALLERLEELYPDEARYHFSSHTGYSASAPK